jgi:uncharacterized protein YfaS (alpha-2-macroglobulin family)
MQFSPRTLHWTIVCSLFFVLLTSQKCKEDKVDTVENKPIVGVVEDTSIILPKFDYSATYPENWDKVDSLKNNGLYGSALQVVQEIFIKAKNENNHPQVVKAIMHKMKFNSFLKEDDFVAAIYELDSITQVADFPLKQIAHAITAEVYWGYYQSNMWQIMGRTFTDNFERKDVRTWDLRSLAHRIVYHRIQSTSESRKLQQLPLINFKDILIYSESDTDSRPLDKFRPTLYDFLAFEAISFFQTAVYDIGQNQDKYVLDNPVIMGDNESFLQMKHELKDSLSNHFYAVNLFKELTTFHLHDKNPEVLIDVTIKRLEFAKSYAVIDNKEKIYADVLNVLMNKYQLHPSVTELMYLKAKWYMANNNPKHADNDEYKKGNVLAYQLANQAIDKYPSSYGAEQCRALVAQLERKSVDMTIEKYVSPGVHQLAKLQYSNLSKIYGKVLKLDKDFDRTKAYNQDLIDLFLKQGKEVQVFEQILPNPEDFNSHSVELPLGPLPVGYYVLLIGTRPDFSIENNAVNYGTFQVTNITFEEYNLGEGTVGIRTFNRESGEPISKAKVTFFTQKWNSIQQKYEYKKQSVNTTDAKGYTSYSLAGSTYQSLYIQVENGDDFIKPEHYVYLYKNTNNSKSKPTTHFFLDRKIYRPGQVIYFKGIVTEKVNDVVQVVPNREVVVELRDVNYQKIQEVRLKTNDFGSYSGQFEAPLGVLTGNMSIRDDYSSTSFKVEEYKRPKFFVQFKPVEGVFKINQQVVVTGEALAYAGNAIDGAEVNYRVTRSARFPYWYWYRYGYMPNSATTEVVSGTTTTDEKGGFTIQFLALEDKTLPSYFSPIYTYSVAADITDVNGETRSGSNYVSVGKQAIEVNAQIDNEVERSSFSFIKIRTNNLNGQKVGVKGKVILSALKMPTKVFRTRSWSLPEFRLLTQAEFDKKFPYDAYENEDKIEEYPISKEMVNAVIDTEKQDTVFIDKKHFKPGKYKLEVICVDQFGTEVRDIKYFTVFDKQANQPATNDIFWMKQIHHSLEPGSTAEFVLASATNVNVNFTVMQHGRIIQEGVVKLNNEQKLFKFPILENHRGTIGFSFTVYKASRNWRYSPTVYVPFTNKELKVSFETFRNKLLPGEEETWKLKLSGPKSEAIAAEMVATLYDASLDEFSANSFWMNINYGKTGSSYLSINSPLYGNAYDYTVQENWNPYKPMPYRYYPSFNWFGFNRFSYNNYYRYNYAEGEEMYYMMDEVTEKEKVGNASKGGKPAPVTAANKLAETTTVATGRSTVAEASKDVDQKKDADNRAEPMEANTLEEQTDMSDVQARSNFNETAFFLPHLETNAKGEIIFSFTIPESMTKWKFLGFAHTKDMMKGSITEYTVTQKDVMVVPNAPRFFRENDVIHLSSKITNMTTALLEGQAQLFLINPFTNQAIDSLMENTQAVKRFVAEAGLSTAVSWKIKVPQGIQAVTYKIVAKSGSFSDGEEMTLPVLSNRMLVTETMPLYINKKGTKQFELKNLITNTSSTLTHHNFTLEYSSNPAWYAIQALPYIMEYPYECAEQTFSRWYANSLAAHVANSKPKIKAVFDEWSKGGKESFLSNLEKNQELKGLFLEETPWVFTAQSEAESKKRIGLLFDLHKMEKEQAKAVQKLEQMQHANGGWPWFKGFKENRYITQHIVMGFGHLNKLGVINSNKNKREWKMINKALTYLDGELLKDFQYVKKHYPNSYLKERHLGSLQIHYLYARSFFDKEMNGEALKEAHSYYIQQAKKYWLDNALQTRAMIALLLHRIKDADKNELDIMKHLKEIVIVHDEMGGYFKENMGGYYWENSQIETQALMIEAFDEVTGDLAMVEELKVWLLKQKQTTHWKTTKATAQACYALFMRGTDMLDEGEMVEIKLGNSSIVPNKTEAGTGYFKKSWTAQEITADMGRVTLTKKHDGASWGAVYWQYFEDLDKIKRHTTPLKITKQLFKVSLDKNGEVITPVSEQNRLKVGDKVRVRIEMVTDRNLEYVHLKDMRAAGFEPLNVLSQYKYKNGLGYYEATKDASTNFFIDWLAKGIYVFEYDLRVFHQGDFSNGITTIQCMYAPEFTSHSEGIRVVVE